jgi:hypothetical protein
MRTLFGGRFHATTVQEVAVTVSVTVSSSDCFRLCLQAFPRRAFEWSEWRDSNSRPSGPKPDALPDCATLRNGECPFFVYPMLTRFVEACNRAYEKRGGRGDLNSRRTGSQPVALPLSYAHHPFFQQTGHVPGGELAEGYLRFQRTVPVGTAAVTAASVS